MRLRTHYAPRSFELGLGVDLPDPKATGYNPTELVVFLGPWTLALEIGGKPVASQADLDGLLAPPPPMNLRLEVDQVVRRDGSLGPGIRATWEPAPSSLVRAYLVRLGYGHDLQSFDLVVAKGGFRVPVPTQVQMRVPATVTWTNRPVVLFQSVFQVKAPDLEHTVQVFSVDHVQRESAPAVATITPSACCNADAPSPASFERSAQ